MDDYLIWETTRQADLIALIFCDLCPLSPQQRRILFGKFRRHLKPGGHLLFDVCSLALFESKEEQALCERNLLDGFFSADDYFGFLNTRSSTHRMTYPLTSTRLSSVVEFTSSTTGFSIMASMN
jgi:hypothetical protein